MGSAEQGGSTWGSRDHRAEIAAWGEGLGSRIGLGRIGGLQGRTAAAAAADAAAEAGRAGVGVRGRAGAVVGARVGVVVAPVPASSA